MSTYAKYLEKFIRKHESEFKKEKENKSHITDPKSYISFLELQVENSSKAVFLVDALAEKIDLMQTQINSLGEKLTNTNKLLQLAEEAKEAQEEDFKETKEKCKKMYDIFDKKGKGSIEKKIEWIEEEVKELSQRLNQCPRAFAEELNRTNDQILRETERKLTDYAESKITSHFQNFNEFKANIDKFLNVFISDITFDLKNLEKKILSDCRAQFITKDEFSPQKSRNLQNFGTNLENLVQEIIERSQKLIYGDIEYLQKQNEIKLKERDMQIEEVKHRVSRYLEELNQIKKSIYSDFKVGLEKIDKIETEVEKERKRKRTAREKSGKQLDHLKTMSSQAFEKINRKKSNETKAKNMERRVKDCLNRNFLKLNNLISQTQTQQNEIKNKMKNLESKTRTITKVLSKKKKAKGTKRNHSENNIKRDTSPLEKETHPSIFSTSEKPYLPHYKPNLTEENKNYKYSSPSLGNPFSDIQFPNYSKEMGSDLFNSKDKIYTNHNYS